MHCGDDFAMYTCVELLCCTPESNTILYVSYTSIKSKGKSYTLIIDKYSSFVFLFSHHMWM